MIFYYTLGDAFGTYRTIYVRTSNNEKSIQKVVLDYWDTDKEEIEIPLNRLRKSIILRDRLDKVNFVLSLILGFICFGIAQHTIETLWFVDFEARWQWIIMLSLALPIGLLLTAMMKLVDGMPLHRFPEGMDWFMAAMLGLGWLVYISVAIGISVGWIAYRVILSLIDSFFSTTFINMEDDSFEWRTDWA